MVMGMTDGINIVMEVCGTIGTKLCLSMGNDGNKGTLKNASNNEEE